MRTGQRSPRRQFYGRSRMRALLNSALYSLVWWMFRPFNGLVRYKSAPQPLRETLKIDPTKPVVYILAQRSWVDMFVLARLCREQVLPRPNRTGSNFPTVERARSEEHTSELKSLMRISYAVFCLNKKNLTTVHIITLY